MAEDIEMTVDLRDFGTFTKVEHSLLHHDDVKAVNTEEDPDNVSPRQGKGGKLEDGRFTIVLPSLSWNVVRLIK
jgi:alpha-N-arabinofuranosidase